MRSRQRFSGFVVVALLGACGGSAFTAGGAPGSGDASIRDASPESDAPVPVDGPDDTTTQDADAGQTDGPITVDASHDGGDASTGGEDAGILSGVVVDSQWQPVANALVAIPLGPSTLTDVQGTFTLAAPSGAYDLAVLSTTSSGVKHGYTFHGLTRHDPTLQLTADSVPFASSRIAGTVALASGATNGLLLIDPGASVVLQSDETITFTSTSVDYSGDAYWVGASNLTATAYQLQWSSTGGVYFTSAATPITLSNAGASKSSRSVAQRMR